MKNDFQDNIKHKKLGTTSVFFTAISAILGAVLFLRLGQATGTLGFTGMLLIIILGHCITIPTSLAISELATNTRVEGGGVYFIISRSFGLKIGGTIGLTLFFSEAISIAFYTIAFAEAFQPVLIYLRYILQLSFYIDSRLISIPSLLIMGIVVLKKGVSSGVKLLYFINAILLVTLLLFMAGHSIADESVRDAAEEGHSFALGFMNSDKFFLWFAICFPAFTGITTGVGLSGELKDPGKSIPAGTILATLVGLFVYVVVAWKFAVSATSEQLTADQLIMSRIALLGTLIVPIGLAASTSSSALGNMMVAPRTLQAIALDKIYPFRKLNYTFAKGKGIEKEPFNATIFSLMISLFFILIGDINSVANVMTMFFLFTYGSLCLISFLNHFGSPPSYRPKFKSRWYISLVGFILSIWTMFKINPSYTIIAYVIIIVLYLFIEHANKDKKGMVNIFKEAIFQLNRQLQIFLQYSTVNAEKEEWRPAVLCLSQHSFEREKALDLMRWIGYKHGFATYFHFIESYYNSNSKSEAKQALNKLIEIYQKKKGSLYIDSVISPSYTGAVSQVIQSPSISGMENNMILFEFERDEKVEIKRIMSNFEIVKAGNLDFCVLAQSHRQLNTGNGIHVWIDTENDNNTDLMIMLGYIFMSHPEWRKSTIKLIIPTMEGNEDLLYNSIKEKIESGRLPITFNNVKIIKKRTNITLKEEICEHSADAALTLIGCPAEAQNDLDFFIDYPGMGDILFVNSSLSIDIR